MDRGTLSIVTLAMAAGFAAAGCDRTTDDPVVASSSVESCMSCHNQASHADYSGPGLENPHPFPGAATLQCTVCHGGDGTQATQAASHVPPPPEIGDRDRQEQNALAYFNRLTLAGLDRFADYEVGGQTYTALDYLQFINPGDLRVVTRGRSCGECHAGHAESSARSMLATEAGIFSGAMYAAGVGNSIPASVGLYQDTAADLAFRAVSDPDFLFDASVVGPVNALREMPVFSVRGGTGADDIFENPAYTRANLPSGQLADGRAIAGSPLANLFHEQVAFTCGDCHLGSAGANNRYGDFRSSGCTSCHMRYALDGRSTSTDPNLNKVEPADPDQIDAPERPHVRRHLLTSVARTLATGETVEGIDDYTCAGCHQGSNRTVMQYWGIRLDQNEDLRRRRQYPADPVTFENTAADSRLFDPVVGNQTFNGRNPHQYILREDYDGDGRDDTPPDVHYDAGLGCIDCHGTHDVHGGAVGDPDDARILSRQEQGVAIRCESCHGTVDAYAATTSGTTYAGAPASVAVDSEGNPLRHVVREPSGEYYLTSRLTGARHYLPQTRDVVVDSGRVHPESGEPVYSEKASYAMGRADGSAATGIGPQQTGGVASGFSHSDTVSCVSCHASWTNSCIGCHLGGEYDNGANFSNITGERIVFRQANADFVYQSPVPFQLGVDAHNRIAPVSPNTKAFFQYEDINGETSQIFAFSDRGGDGNNPSSGGRGALPALGHNAMMPHSIRGRVDDDNEGPRYCVACHLTSEGLATYDTEYEDFRTAIAGDDFASLDYDLLREHIGQNPGNQLDSPIWVHMVAGLGTGLFLFDAEGCPTNPIDDDANRIGCDGTAPRDNVNAPAFNMDRLVQPSGVANSSNNHARLDAGAGASLRDGALNEDLAGPLGATLIQRLADPTAGIILDSWLDADGALQGNAADFVPGP